jgi:hypothetical protein
MRNVGHAHPSEAEARGSSILTAGFDRFVFFALAVVCAGGIALWKYEEHVNAHLRAELARVSEPVHPPPVRRSLPPAVAPGDSEPRKPDASANVTTMLQADQVEPAVLRIIHEHLLAGNRAEAERLIARIASADMLHAFDLVERNAVGAARFQLRNALLSAWAKQDPRAAARAADDFPTRDRHEAQATVANAWADTDPEAAVKYCYSERAFQKWVTRAPEQAALAAEMLQYPAYTVSRAAAAWARKDAIAAWKWASGLAADYRYYGVSAVISEIAATDPAVAAAYVAAEPTTAPYDKLPALVVGQWAATDPAAAAQWASGLPASDGRGAALENVVRSWASRDPAAAAEWIQTLPDSEPRRDILLTEFVTQALGYSPEVAARVVVQIHSDSQRDAEIGSVASVWLHVDAIRARQWLAGIRISTNVRQRLNREGYRDLPSPPGGGS